MPRSYWDDWDDDIRVPGRDEELPYIDRELTHYDDGFARPMTGPARRGIIRRAVWSRVGRPLARAWGVVTAAEAAYGVGKAVYKRYRAGIDKHVNEFTPEKKRRYDKFESKIFENDYDKIKRFEAQDKDNNSEKNMVTSQYNNISTLYRGGKRLSKRARRSYKRFIKNQLRSINNNVFKFNSGGVDTAAADQYGVSFIPTFFSLAGTLGTGWDDLNLISVQMGVPASDMSGRTGTIAWLDKARMYIQKVMVTIDLANTSSTDILTCDIYHCKARSNKISTPNTPADAFVASPVFFDDPAAASVNALAVTDQGLSLFDLTYFTSSFVIKKAQQVILQPGQQVEYSYKRGLAVIDNRDVPVSSATECCHDRTEFIVVLFQGQLKNNAGSAQYAAGTLAYKSHRTYYVKFLNTSPSSNTVNLENQNL